MRVFPRALATIDPYAFDDVVKQFAANDENNERTSEEILLSAIDGLPDDKLTGFALRLVLTAHTPIPREGKLDLLPEADTEIHAITMKRLSKSRPLTILQTESTTSDCHRLGWMRP
jgi:hypothetical protein